PFTLTDVATVTGQPTHRVVTDLAPAFTAGVLVDDETAHLTRFRHDLVRDAIEDDLPHSVRVALHRDAARRLGEAGAPPLQVAEHLTRSATPGDTEAVDWLARAAHEIAGVSPGAAVDLLGHALTLTTPTHPRSVELRVEQAGLAMWAGRLADAEQICREVLVTTEPSAAAEPAAPGTAAARLHLGQSLLGQGRVEEALAELEQVSDDEATPAQRATSHAWAATALISLTELDRAESAARAALTGADPEAEALALTALALIAASRAKPYDALELSDRALDRADASPYGRAHRYPHHLTRGHLQLEVDEFDRARATFERGLRASERLGAEWTLGSYGTALAVEAFLTGEWDTAIDSFTQGLGHSRTSGERYNEVAGHSALAVIAIHRNDLDRARTHLDDALSGVGSGTGSGWRYRGHWAGWARALVAEADGAPDRALEILQQTWDSCRRTDLAIEYPLLGPTLVRLALDQDRRDLAAEAAADVARLVDGAAPPNFRLADRHCRGLVHADAGLLVTAGSLVEHRPLARAAVAEDAARLLADAGSDRGAAVAQLRIALELYQGLGATWSMARVQARLRGLGVRSGVRGTRQRPRSGWSSLTDTERTVAELAASGLTNPQIGERLFVSRRTVQTHLSHIFVKLGMSSRTELIRATPAPPD
ncbi:MAG TPA: hypothetical protein IAA98_11755, partial [Candidatus Avipropionibacterium avicola]|nr:hypothetical protein [Candidatus Avipropionibacterium avicola]